MKAIRWCLFLYTAFTCHGYPDLPYFYEMPSCSDKLEERDSVPFYDFDKPQQPFDKRSDSVYNSEFSTPSTSVVASENWKDFLPKNEDIRYLTVLNSPQSLKPSLSRKKRSVDEDESLVEDSVERQEYSMAVLPTLLRQSRNNVKTIHLPSSFTPRLGKKRSGDKYDRSRGNEDFQMSGITGRSHVINLSAGNAFTPRLGRSEGSTRIQLNAGSAFTPRLGRSQGLRGIRLNTGGAFTPRMSRSEGRHRIHLNAGSAFTPRLGRSEGTNKIYLNAGSAFTPRLGRSENPNRVTLNAGSAFTPRLG